MDNFENKDSTSVLHPYLEQLYGGNVNKKFRLNRSVVHIGNSLKSDIKVNSDNVSQNHCILQQTHSGWILVNCDDVSGTYINGMRLGKYETACLKFGDVIFLGPPSDLPTVFIFEKGSFDEREDVQGQMNLDEEEESSEKENFQPACEISKIVSEEIEKDQKSQETNSENLKSAQLSEEIKHLEKWNSDLLKEYADACEKNKLQLSKQKKLEEDLQICEIRLKKKFKDQMMEKLENELMCNICTELLIKPIVLSCSHSFCEFCIKEWKKVKNQCPTCRSIIKSETPVLAVDHFIDKTLEALTPEKKIKRRKLVSEREEKGTNSTFPIMRNRIQWPTVVTNSIQYSANQRLQSVINNLQSYSAQRLPTADHEIRHPAGLFLPSAVNNIYRYNVEIPSATANGMQSSSIQVQSSAVNNTVQSYHSQIPSVVVNETQSSGIYSVQRQPTAANGMQSSSIQVQSPAVNNTVQSYHYQIPSATVNKTQSSSSYSVQRQPTTANGMQSSSIQMQSSAVNNTVQSYPSQILSAAINQTHNSSRYSVQRQPTTVNGIQNPRVVFQGIAMNNAQHYIPTIEPASLGTQTTRFFPPPSTVNSMQSYDSQVSPFPVEYNFPFEYY